MAWHRLRPEQARSASIRVIGGILAAEIPKLPCSLPVVHVADVGPRGYSEPRSILLRSVASDSRKRTPALPRISRSCRSCCAGQHPPNDSKTKKKDGLAASLR